MRTVPIPCLVALLSWTTCLPAGAQAKARAQKIYAQRLAQKLAAPFLKRGDWLLDWEAAKAMAAKKRKPIFAFFTRSYVRCRPCERVEAGPLRDPKLRKLAKLCVLFAHITSRVAGRPNDGLLRQLVARDEVYPTILFLDSSGSVLYEQPRAQQSIDDFVANATKVQRLAKVAAKAHKSKGAAVELLVTRIELDLIGYSEATRQAARLVHLGRHAKARLGGALANLEFADLRKQRLSKRRLGARLVGMRKAGRIPTSADAWLFYWYLLDYAALERDPKLFASALDRVKELKKHDRRFKQSIQGRELELSKLKKRR